MELAHGIEESLDADENLSSVILVYPFLGWEARSAELKVVFFHELISLLEKLL